ncbi:MAG: DUF5011 domain-containing protein [Clostridia bacterium]|nr:DUF5011 domain-containing protein [Clostridia bacterium]
MKRIFLTMLSIAFCFSLFACGGAVNESSDVRDSSVPSELESDIESQTDKQESLAESSEASEATESSGEAEESEQSLPDTDVNAPIITVKNATVIINVGDKYDLMTGVSGYDEEDGDITDKITIDKGGFDSAKAGEYTVTYNLTDNAGNTAEEKVCKVVVVGSDDGSEYAIYNGTIAGEKLNPKPHPVFGGAWYHKVVSSKDKWLGIEATVTLPEVKLSRYNGASNPALDVDPNVKSKDNPSVYLGGNAYSESDVGLSFSLGVINTKTNTISKGSIAFRPFWRYITETDQDVGGYDAHGGKYTVTANGNNCYANYHWSYTEYYYLPGDKLRISVYSPEPDKLQLKIEVIEKSTLASSVEMREKYGWKDPADFVSPIFSSLGHGKIDAEFKRVNAIDQSGNEGGVAANTNTEISNAIWHSTYLYREIDGVIYRVPMNESRCATTDAPYKEAFDIITDEKSSAIGGETVTIRPNNE